MTIFFASDHHFSHANVLKFKCLDGVTPIRPGFSSVEHMDETLIRNHNKVVRPGDKIYFGGDVVFNAQALHRVMPRLNGEKVLILGNHDKLRMDEYLKYFKSIYSARNMNDIPELKGMNIVLCHYPLHIDANYPKHPICVCGHIHEKTIKLPDGRDDPRYFNI